MSIESELRALEDRNGRIQPQRVVDAARPRNHPLHPYFEWDNKVAGENWRLAQARALIRTVRFEVIINETPLMTVRYLRDPDRDAKDAGYRSIVQIRNEEETARAAVVAEMSHVAAAVRRAKLVAASLGLTAKIAAIGELADEITRGIDPPPAPPQ
jgi:hypothetical protein